MSGPTEPIGVAGPEPERGGSARPSDSARPERDRAKRRDHALVLASIAVLALAGLALAFFVGTRLGGGGASAAAPTPTPTASSPSPTPTPTPTPTATEGPVAAGEHEWDELLGGECIDPFESVWERTFSVVSCTTGHAAQLVARGAFTGKPGTPYPGAEELTSKLNLLCTSPDALDLEAAGDYTDLRVQAAYPAGEEQWADGDRSWFCFVFRKGGKELEGSLAA